MLTSLHLSFGLPIFRCAPTSILHVFIIISYLVFLSTWPNHLGLASLIVSLVFTTPVIALTSSFLISAILFTPITHLNIIISVLSSQLCSAFLSAHVSLPYIRKSLMTVLLYCCFEFSEPTLVAYYSDKTIESFQNSSQPQQEILLRMKGVGWGRSRW